ncbi:hypothetical protein PISMIDRAFT_679573, partial [Pisolithus microcarpus 441]
MDTYIHRQDKERATRYHRKRAGSPSPPSRSLVYGQEPIIITVCTYGFDRVTQSFETDMP